ncbi:hypothetical protein NQZ68_001358 [Dissostichus eleginoides]|nr:hypothetical protein NQZ68_001358 [Dissostichus eleginoides]
MEGTFTSSDAAPVVTEHPPPPPSPAFLLITTLPSSEAAALLREDLTAPDRRTMVRLLAEASGNPRTNLKVPKLLTLDCWPLWANTRKCASYFEVIRRTWTWPVSSNGDGHELLQLLYSCSVFA